METYCEYIFEHNKCMPNPEEDVFRFADLHSWYKHLHDFDKAYPLLLQGEEHRYDFDPQYTDKNKKNFHWRIVLACNLDKYGVKISDNSEYVLIPEDIKQFMKKFPIYLDNDFCQSNNPKARFLRHICVKMCEEFWNELQELNKLSKLPKKEIKEESIN